MSYGGNRFTRLPALLKQSLMVLLSLLIVGFVWHLAIVVFHVPGYLVPEPLAVIYGFFSNGPVIARHAAFTAASAAAGLAASTAFAVSVAAACTISRRFTQASMPIVIAFRSAPVAAVAPIIMLAIGRGMGTSIVVVLIISFFPLLVNLMRGLQAANHNVLELLHVYNASLWHQLRYVRMPYALPFFFTGLRIAGTSSILGAMLSEWITGAHGLGLLILDSGEMREIELLWSSVLAAIMLSLSVFWITSVTERKFLHWC